MFHVSQYHMVSHNVLRSLIMSHGVIMSDTVL